MVLAIVATLSSVKLESEPAPLTLVLPVTCNSLICVDPNIVCML